MVPLIPGLDELRHATWTRTLLARDIKIDSDALNFCRKAANSEGLCSCIDPLNTDVMSIDSAYYDGVLEGMEHYLCTYTQNFGYAVFSDYHKPAVNEDHCYTTPDQEAKVTITVDDGFYQVESAVRGNALPYKHRIVNTGNGSCWARHHPDLDCTVVYEKLDQFEMGAHNYILVVMTPIVGRPAGFEYLTDYFLRPAAQPETPASQQMLNVIRYGGGMVKTAFKQFAKAGKMTAEILKTTAYWPGEIGEWWHKGEIQVLKDLQFFFEKQRRQIRGLLSEEQQKALEPFYSWIGADLCSGMEVNFDEKKNEFIVTITLEQRNENEDSVYTDRPIRVSLEVIRTCYPAFLCTADTSVLNQIARKMAKKYEDSKINPQVVADSVSLAHYMAMRATIRLHEFATNEVTLVAQHMLKDKWGYRVPLSKWWEFNGGRIFKYVKWFVIVSLWCVLINYLCGSGIGGAAAAGPGFVAGEGTGVGVQILVIFMIQLLHFLMTSKPPTTTKHKVLPKERWLKSTCVTVTDRLDMTKPQGRSDPKWKFRNPDWDITGLNGEQAMEELGCDCEDKILAGQVGPAWHGEVKRTPTVKHKCKRCVMAAALRATSNKIEPDPVILAEWREFFLNDARDARQKIIDEGGVRVEIEGWLSHYPTKYRDNMREVIQSPFLTEKFCGNYESFPKIELQFTSVAEILKNSVFNNLKERQITCPDDFKKCLGGPGTYALEGLFHRNYKWYCGRQNWEQICASLDDMIAQFDDPVAGAADMSGLDMTLGTSVARTQTDAITIIVRDNNFITWDQPIDEESMIRAYKESELLNVSVNRGDVGYQIGGRASGDSWTTFSNTWIVASMFRFALSKLGFNPYADGKRFGYKSFALKAKGDDTVFLVERRDLELAKLAINLYFALQNDYQKYGLGTVVKFVKWGEIDEMDFLSNQFFKRADGTLRMVRIPARVFQSMPWSIKVTETTRDLALKAELCYSKGACLKSWSKGLPIFEKLADKYISLGKKNGNYVDTMDYQYVDQYRQWDNHNDTDYEACAQWMYHYYGVTMEDIREIEYLIEHMEQFDHFSHPVIEKFYAAL